MPTCRPEISVAFFAERLTSGEPLVVLDVRRPAERALCAIWVPPTSSGVFVPMDEVPDRLDEIRAASERGPLVVYCHHGVRSGMVVEWLIGQGLTPVLNLAGGIDAWSLGVDPGVPRY